MPLFRKKPVVIEAHQLPEDGGDLSDGLLGFLHGLPEDAWFFLGKKIAIKTLEGDMTASPGDWIIKGVADEIYPCKPDIFAATYEPPHQDMTKGLYLHAVHNAGF